MKVAGPLVGPNGMTVYVHLIASTPLECQLLLASTGHRKLMIAHWRVEHPPPFFTTAKLVEYHRITSGDGVCDDASYAIEWDVVDTEAPNKVFDVADVLLVGLGCK